MKTESLEGRIGYRFKKRELLIRALTHSSWAREHFANIEAKRDAENESLEFVGDSVLGLVVAEQLFLMNPGSGEGDLTLMKHHIVSASTLGAVARSLGLGDFVRLGKGEEHTGGRKKTTILADALEAVIAAVFFDGGYPAARDFVARIFEEQLRQATPRGSLDYKTLLQETLQARRMTPPTYALLRTEGPPHERIFFVQAEWETGCSFGSGRSRKLAEMAAAGDALEQLRMRPAAADDLEG